MAGSKAHEVGESKGGIVTVACLWLHPLIKIQCDENIWLWRNVWMHRDLTGWGKDSKSSQEPLQRLPLGGWWGWGTHDCLCLGRGQLCEDRSNARFTHWSTSRQASLSWRTTHCSDYIMHDWVRETSAVCVGEPSCTHSLTQSLKAKLNNSESITGHVYFQFHTPVKFLFSHVFVVSQQYFIAIYTSVICISKVKLWHTVTQPPPPPQFT